MEAGQTLLALIGACTSFVTFCLMRFPQTRRSRFQRYGPFSLIASFFGALTILLISALTVYAQAVWH
ncbi:MAG TPA: hypothetical protein VN647_03745 [Nitrospira sp.]|jgi:hypothetical protein|nr:hypothetical protein [Nitrospira sp.]HWV44604.1 hypothetical protein [Nitrospira sp.]